MSNVIAFPPRAKCRRFVAITPVGSGFDVDVAPGRSDLAAWFATYAEAEAYALGLSRTTTAKIVDVPSDGQVA
ncbi:hypothetical protein FHS91_003923 [Sphingobium xanthum]|uniref:hypothetical protein n=1 Tax=Sphingobium xanthum TaxID=1387165 RepID=UPI001C8CC4D9|nr:hypothetical protein [Sphingobium xanthum]